ncbi:MAG: hypothetical protein HZB24_10465 [Desulfobacterales bacterium]|nr:hypothetical protein [Desulfobacterales bacterium]
MSTAIGCAAWWRPAAAAFPTELVGGYWLGGVLLFIAIGPALYLERWLRRKGPNLQLTAAVVLPLVLMSMSPGKTSVTVMAALMGFAVGLVAEARWVGFDCDGDWRRRGLRFLLGAAVLLAVWAGLRQAFAAFEPEMLFRFIRYLFTSLWTAWGAPWAFVRLGLAGKRRLQDKGDDHERLRCV